MKRARVLTTLVAIGVLGLVATSPASAIPAPTGETAFGHKSVEPAYDDTTGALLFLSTPEGSAAHVNPQFAHNVAPIYLPVYPPDGWSGTLNCQDVPVENCPDHGPEVAGAAMFGYPSIPGAPHAADVGAVYAHGVRGHDHLVGVASTGGDFNILWEPVLVLFTNADAAKDHVTTLAQIDELVANGDAVELPLPSATFPCAIVSSAVYYRGTPVAG